VSTFLDTGNHIFQIYQKFLVILHINLPKPVLNKIIHTDQKGFVAGRYISENNRMIDDIIEFVDNEDEEGVIIFVDQQNHIFQIYQKFLVILHINLPLLYPNISDKIHL
jgi:hypothetical protein